MIGVNQATAVPIPSRLISRRRETLDVIFSSIALPSRGRFYRTFPDAVLPCRRRDRGPMPQAGRHFGSMQHDLGMQA